VITILKVIIVYNILEWGRTASSGWSERGLELETLHRWNRSTGTAVGTRVDTRVGTHTHRERERARECVCVIYPVPSRTICRMLGRPCGARPRNLCDASAKSSTALTVLAREMVSGLPLSPCFEPPSRLGTLLNASPTSLRNSLRSSLNLGQSTSTWMTVSCAPHTHRSSSL
jgi:hypothetical protein